MEKTNIYASDAQLAQRYAVSRSTIWRWAADEKLGFPQSIKISEGCTRWRLDDIERFDATRAGKSPAQLAREEIKSDEPEHVVSSINITKPKSSASRSRSKPIRRRKAR